MYNQQIVDDNTILIDGGNILTFSSSEIRNQATQQLNVPANELNFYHVKSVRYGLVVVSKLELTPDQTRPIAKSGTSA